MSGITPILDTLLHQVLGKRVDVPLEQPLQDPVKPLQGGQAPLAVRSDSRLDPRALPARESGVAAGQDRSGPAPPPPAADTASSSTRTHFSPAARTIADLLTRYPAPPSAVRPALPLMSGAEQGAPEVATRLRGSLEQSGLFYESHLQGWFQGRRDGAVLAREPQMRLFLEARAAAAPGTTATGDGEPAPGPGRAGPAVAAAAQRAPGVAAPGAQPPASSAAPMTGAPATANQTTAPTTFVATGAEEQGADDARPSEPGPRPALSDTQRDALHGILRHQLEMLATPVLRWEGDVWSGVFMALMIQLPDGAPERREREAGEGEGQGDESAPDTWRTGLTVSLPALGEVRVNVVLGGDRVDLSLNAGEEAARRLRAGGGRLRERLLNLGLGEVRVTVGEDKDDDH